MEIVSNMVELSLSHTHTHRFKQFKYKGRILDQNYIH